MVFRNTDWMMKFSLDEVIYHNVDAFDNCPAIVRIRRENPGGRNLLDSLMY